MIIMKHLFLLPAFLFHIILYSQGCLPEGITFTTQEQIDNFQINYPGCTEIEGDVKIIFGLDITNLSGLSPISSIGDSLCIFLNPFLSSLSGLESLTSIGGSLIIGNDWGGNQELNSIASIHNLSYIGEGINIRGNPLLTSLEGLENITSIPGSLSISLNENLFDLNGLNNLEEVAGDVIIQHSKFTDFNGMDNLNLIGHDFILYSNDSLLNFNGLNNLTTIDGEVTIDGNQSLVNFTGLEGLSFVGSDFYLNDNESLQDFNGLSNLVFIGGYFNIFNNPIFCTCNGINSLVKIGTFLRIHNNPSLTSLQSLGSMNLVDGFTISFNNSLTTLAGLDNINADSLFYFEIVYNDQLSVCDVQSICNYILTPNVNFYIIDNAPGCNSPEEVEEHCLTSLKENSNAEELILSPNPTSSLITITTAHNQPVEKVIIYNHLGQKVLIAKPVNNTVDVSTLRPGIYFIEVAAKDWSGRTKIIKQ
jgi:hypothetical protein